MEEEERGLRPGFRRRNVSVGKGRRMRSTYLWPAVIVTLSEGSGADDTLDAVKILVSESCKCHIDGYSTGENKVYVPQVPW